LIPVALSLTLPYTVIAIPTQVGRSNLTARFLTSLGMTKYDFMDRHYLADSALVS